MNKCSPLLLEKCTAFFFSLPLRRETKKTQGFSIFLLNLCFQMEFAYKAAATGHPWWHVLGVVVGHPYGPEEAQLLLYPIT